MKRPHAGLVALVAAPFLTACLGVNALPVPEPAARSEVEVRGVVLTAPEGGEGEWVQASRVDDVRWTDTEIVITGEFERGAAETRRWPISDLSGILVRGVDVNKTSAIVAGVVVGAIGLIAVAVTGKGDQGPLR